MRASDPMGDTMVERYRALYALGQQQGLRGPDLASFALINLVLEFAFLSEPTRPRLQPIPVRRGQPRRRSRQSQ